MSQGARTRNALKNRKRVRSAPLFPTATLPKQPRPVAKEVPDRPHWFVRFVRSIGSTFIRYRVNRG